MWNENFTLGSIEMPLYSASESEGLYFGNFCTKAIAAILLLFFISMSVHACMIYGTI